MVARVIMVLSVLGWLLLPARGFGAALPLHLTVVSTQVEYGKPITVDLSVHDVGADLKALDLSPLDEDFVVKTSDNIEHDIRGGRQSWRIHLYPRRSDVLLIPSLVLHGHKTEPVKIIVAPALERKNSPMQVSSEIGDTHIWLNQAVRVTMEIETGSRYARLESGTAQQDGIEIEPIPYTRHTRTKDGKQRTQHRIGWVLYPQVAGNISIQLPSVNYEHNGRVTHRFYPPKVELRVRALPSFVPPTMPIGRVQLNVSLPNAFFLFKNELAFLALRIRSEGPPGQRPFAVLRQLKSNSTVTVYSPRKLSGEGGADTNGDEDRYQVAFAPKAMGMITLPSVRLQYFDPATGKIVTHTQSLGGFVAISQWLLYLGLVVVAPALYILIRSLYRRAKLKYKIYCAYRTAVYVFQQADTPQEIKSGLMEIAGGECWPSNLTLAVWLDNWIRCYPRLSSVSDSVLRLQSWLYGRTDARLDEIRRCLIDICYQRVPLLGIQALIQRGVRSK